MSFQLTKAGLSATRYLQDWSLTPNKHDKCHSPDWRIRVACRARSGTEMVNGLDQILKVQRKHADNSDSARI
jgi:hypothetical protein